MNNQISFLISKILQRIPGITRQSVWFNDYRHQKNYKKLLPLFIEAEKKASLFGTNINSQRIVWVMWWQGIEYMPSLVKKCYESIKRNSGDYQVILISKNNLNDYVQLSPKIVQKIENHQITLTHLSDIIRFQLLYRYGGLWADSTLFITGSLNRIDIQQIFTCSGYPTNRNFNIAKGRWTGFFIGGPQHSPLFGFLNSFFEDYWEKNDRLIDFFLIDYALNYAWENNIGEFQTTSKKFNGNDPKMFKLLPILNEKFDAKVANDLTQNSYAFKLSLRKKINNMDKDNFYNNLGNLKMSEG